MSRKVVLPSGAILEITAAPFDDAKALYMAVADEARGLKLDSKAEIDANFWKDIFCTGLASKKIEAALAVCFKRVTYSGLKIDKDTFEPIEAREDYLTVCFEVAKENVSPFLKSLYARFSPILEKLAKFLA